jgi:lipopolysaccharide biosynthesis glycosyltransferase
MNSSPDEYYDIFILCSENVSETDKQQLCHISEKYERCCFNFIDLSNQFNDSFEIRNITKAAYYRLIIPLLIPQYSKIIYSDVDVIFLEGLNSVYNEDITNDYLAAVLSRGAVFDKEYNRYVRGLNLDPWMYVHSGFLLINSQKMIEDDICSRFKLYASKKFHFQDQDIINIACKGKIKFLPLKYAYTQGVFSSLYTSKTLLLQRFSEKEISDASRAAIVHYEGQHKPWNSYCFRYDVWWEYYRKSVFFDAQFYFKVNNSLLPQNITFKNLMKTIIAYGKTSLKRIIRRR